MSSAFFSFCQVGISVAVVGGSRYDVVLAVEGVEHAYALIFAYIKLYFLLVQDATYHLAVFLYYVVLHSVVIQHLEVGRVNGNLYFIDKFLVVKVNVLHCLWVNLVLQEQMCLCYGFASQVMKEGLATGMFADNID